MTCDPDALAETLVLPLMALAIKLAIAEVDIPWVPSDQCTGIPVPATVTVMTPDSGPPGTWLIEIVAVPEVPDWSAPELNNAETEIDPLLPVAGLTSADVAWSDSERTRVRLSYVRASIRAGVRVEESTPYCAFINPIGP